ncbi:kelch-like protein 3 [Metopolophium dirhodum]|uniref:kelch-like protein 3 n=1 Tax=Metopolophium dirhodum TaxID=44670 RepID=UPI0029906E81|nr:kelch-like protein 3 [Metopolophium dirhodum]
MDSVKHVIPWISGQKEVLKSNGCESKLYINSCHTPSLIQVLQSLHREGVLCAIKFETEDGVIVYVHKVVLVSASPYFRAMFTNFAKRDGDVVLFPAANLLQLNHVKCVSVDFLQKHLNPSNCFGIKGFADFYNCMELSSSSEECI